MGFRFRKSVKAGPFRINFSKSGIGYSVGGKGFRYTKKANGGTRTTYSIPGTGISYVEETGAKKKRSQAKKQNTVVGAASNLKIPSNDNGVNRTKQNIAAVETAYCSHCYKMVDASAKNCPNCGWPMNAIKGTPQRKINWPLYIGIFCLFGAVVMLFVDILGSLMYAVIAFLLLRKSRQLTQDSKAHPHIDTSPAQSEPVVFYPKKKDATIPQTSTEMPETTEDELSEMVSQALQTPDVIKPTLKTFTAKVTGMQHYVENILNLAVENPDYDMTKKEIIDSFMTDERIYEYNFFPTQVKLVPEPDNPYDKNAVMVFVDGEHVGYIKAGSCAHILKLLREDRVHRIDAEIGGGKYKIVCEDENDETYTLERNKTNYFVHLTIYENVK